MRHVYILHCADDTYYTGITTDLERRISEHNAGLKGAKYTRVRQPVSLARSTSAPDRATASTIEYSIKRLTKSRKLQLISGGYNYNDYSDAI